MFVGVNSVKWQEPKSLAADFRLQCCRQGGEVEKLESIFKADPNPVLQSVLEHEFYPANEKWLENFSFEGLQLLSTFLAQWDSKYAGLIRRLYEASDASVLGTHAKEHVQALFLEIEQTLLPLTEEQSKFFQDFPPEMPAPIKQRLWESAEHLEAMLSISGTRLDPAGRLFSMSAEKKLREGFELLKDSLAQIFLPPGSPSYDFFQHSLEEALKQGRAVISGIEGICSALEQDRSICLGLQAAHIKQALRVLYAAHALRWGKYHRLPPWPEDNALKEQLDRMSLLYDGVDVNPTCYNFYRRIVISALAPAYLVELGREIIAGKKSISSLVSDAQKQGQALQLLMDAAGILPRFIEQVESVKGAPHEIENTIKELDLEIRRFSKLEQVFHPQLTADLDAGRSKLESLAVWQRASPALLAARLAEEGVSETVCRALRQFPAHWFAGSRDNRLDTTLDFPQHLPSLKRQLEIEIVSEQGGKEHLILSPGEQRVMQFVESVRMKHIDSSLKNPLVNYRRGARRSDVEVSGVVLKDILEGLRQGKSLMFLAKDTKAAENHCMVLTTSYEAAELEAKLCSLAQSAAERLQEFGFNGLYLGLGLMSYRLKEGNLLLEDKQAPLLLLPVAISGRAREGNIAIHCAQEGLELNEALAARLEKDYGVKLPALPEAQGFDLTCWLEKVKSKLTLPQLSLDAEWLGLGFFSSARFMMYQDLDYRRWPPGRRPWEDGQPAVRTLLSDVPAPPRKNWFPLRVDAALDYQRHLYVLDCDASQMAAMLEAERNRLTVIHGPPGTGKSQTIVNLMASFVAQGKSVLFIAKKKAARDVVEARLSEVGLRECCLVVEGDTLGKSEFRKAIQNAFCLGEPKQNHNGLPEQYELLRQTLDEYNRSISTEIGQSGLSPWQAMERLLELPSLGGTLALKDLAAMRHWSGKDLSSAQAWVKTVEDALPVETLKGLSRCYRGVGLKEVKPDCAEKICELATALKSAIKKHQERGLALKAALQARLPGVTLDEVLSLYPLLSQLSCGAIVIKSALMAEDLQAAVQILLGVQACEKKLADTYRGLFRRAVWQSAGGQAFRLRERHRSYGSWYSFLQPGYYLFKHELKRKVFAAGCLPKTWDLQGDALDALCRHASNARAFANAMSMLSGRVKQADWQAHLADPDFPAFLKNAQAILLGGTPGVNKNLLHKLLDVCSAEVAAGSPVLLESLTIFQRELCEINALESELLTILEVESPEKEAMQASSFEQKLERLDAWQANLGNLVVWAQFNRLRRNFPLDGAWVYELLTGHAGSLVQRVEALWLHGLLGWAAEERPALEAFDAGRRQEIISDFCRLDRQILLDNRCRLMHRIWSRIPRHDAGGQTKVLRMQLERNRGTLGPRELFEQAPDVLLRLIPIMIMSPEAVSKYLPRGSPVFDVAIVDEASQMLVEEALPAMMRARRFVAVGDPHQLPPTNYLFSDCDTEEEDFEGSRQNSILDLLLARGVNKVMLQNAYRFEHPSLIEPFNDRIYEGQLKTFVSPYRENSELGLRYVYQSNSSYERGKSRQNREEAAAIARAVLEHATLYPGKSLGVVAFSEAQMRAIRKEINRLFAEHPEIQQMLMEHPRGSFFVKNLESVQGDERDVMFISIGYGRDAEERFVMNLGPLNRTGGEKRITVVFTRARSQARIFTSMQPEDLARAQGGAKGLKLLKEVLECARSADKVSPWEQDLESLSPFLRDIKEYLSGQGRGVVTVFKGNCGPELGVLSQDGKRCVLGLMTDGPLYQQAGCVRERERLRPEALQKLGWRLHRLSLDGWVKDRQVEIEKLERALNDVLGGVSETIQHLNTDTSNSRKPVANLSLLPFDSPPYTCARLHPDPRLSFEKDCPRLVLEVVAVEGPVHRLEVCRRIEEVMGRSSSVLREDILRVIDSELRKGALIKLHEGFLSLAGDIGLRFRSRGAFEPPYRTLSMVSPDEIDAAIICLAGKSCGLHGDSIAEDVCQYAFGICPLLPGERELIHARVDWLVAQGVLRKEGNFYK